MPVPQDEPTNYAEQLAFLTELYSHDEARARTGILQQAIEADGWAGLTKAELTLGGKIAWRNSSRCIGRLHWKSLKVRDHRHIERAGEIAESLSEHLTMAQADGRIQSVMTVFAPSTPNTEAPRIWNHQLCGYAGYRDRHGHIFGDPKNEEFTSLALEMGWRPPDERTPFDLLPWIISAGGERPQLHLPPAGLIREVSIRHPHFEWVAALGLRWYAVPVISDMCFHIAATDHPAAPFNGWYMSTEIAARDLTDVNRYNVLPALARKMGLDTSHASTLWKDRALLELNIAVLHSFDEEGIRLVDHHTAAEEFMRFLAKEKAAHREVSARWDWIVPPMSPATTPVFHMSMREYARTPEFRLQKPAWKA